MKQILTILIIQICLTTYGQININEVDKSLAKINVILYASKYEVSNMQYTNFLNSLKKANKTDLLAIAKIDTLKWSEKMAYNEPYAKYYHSHPAYKDYPVVNITYDAAILFCKWLTDEYNSYSNRKYKKVLFRLPTEQEWIKAAQGGVATAIYPWKGTDIKNKKDFQMCNYAKISSEPIDDAGNLNKATDITAPVESYKPNGFGLYNMSGNVAEMVADKKNVKGGSWVDTEEFMRIDSKKRYDGSAKSSVGFRYFVDINEK